MDIENKVFASNTSNDYAFRIFFYFQALQKFENIEYNYINKHSRQIKQ